MRDRNLLMIPGPVEFEPEVMLALGAPTTSHLDPAFMDAFGQALERMRDVWQSPSGQPFVVAGSGTLAMELAGANLIEAGERALVVTTGLFGDRFADLLSRHGAKVKTLRAPLGGIVEPDRIDVELRRAAYKLVTVTHVDTSTAVRMPLVEIGQICRRHNALSVVDGVCSVAGEEVLQDLWELDVVLTASQKALGVPPGLALLVASPQAMEAFRARKSPVRSYYADWAKWLPVMAAYEARKPSYFGTPAVNLVAALNVSLGRIIAEGMAARWQRHARMAQAFQAGIEALELRQVPLDRGTRAHTLTGCYYPERCTAGLVQAIAAAGVVVAAGLHPEIKDSYFRIGHMGAVRAGDVLATLGAIETGLRWSGVDVTAGSAVSAAQRELVS